jgi:hypothetical protein
MVKIKEKLNLDSKKIVKESFRFFLIFVKQNVKQAKYADN